MVVHRFRSRFVGSTLHYSLFCQWYMQLHLITVVLSRNADQRYLLIRVRIVVVDENKKEDLRRI